jgi:hypothetical protein
MADVLLYTVTRESVNGVLDVPMGLAVGVWLGGDGSGLRMTGDRSCSACTLSTVCFLAVLAHFRYLFSECCIHPLPRFGLMWSSAGLWPIMEYGLGVG